MDLREKFVLRANVAHRNMAELCREFGISRKTGYYWLKRYRREGITGLEDRSHRRRRVLQTSGEIVLRIAEMRREHRFWGPKKLRMLLQVELGEAPSVKTIARITKRLALAPLRRHRDPKREVVREGGALKATRCNEVWTFDFKGWWKTKDGKRFEPLTVRDAASRFILLCKHSPETFDAVKKHCESLFRQYGLPQRIRADNGPPFAASHAIGGLSRLSAWWMSLGIDVSYSRPGTPSDNGGHERMHCDMAIELQSEPAQDTDSQQQLVDDWVRIFNHVRPHEALGFKTPASMYQPSKKKMKVRKPSYPADAIVARVSVRGRIALDGFQYFVGTNLTGMSIGIRKIDGKLRVLFFDKQLGILQSTPQRRH